MIIESLFQDVSVELVLNSLKNEETRHCPFDRQSFGISDSTDMTADLDAKRVERLSHWTDTQKRLIHGSITL